MKRHTLAAFGLATSLVLGASSLASANPGITMSTNPTGGQLGEHLDFWGTECINGDNPGFGGIFVDDGVAMFRPWEVPADGVGDWFFDADLQAPLGTYDGYFYCSQTSTTDIDDPNMLWVSAPYTYTVSEATPDARGRSAERDTVVTMTVDPEAVPLVDNVGLSGEEAIALKATVDANAATFGQASRLYKAYFGRYGDTAGIRSWASALESGTSPAAVADAFNRTAEAKRAFVPLSHQQFIDTVYENTLGRPAEPSAKAFWLAQLRSGMLRSRMILSVANSNESMTVNHNRTYVATTFATVGLPVPAASTVDEIARPLDDRAVPRVEVVEAIALG